MAPFQYAPLGDDEIRIIGFEESEGASSTISVKIEHVKRPKVSNTPEGNGLSTYHALSYAWGSGKHDRPILINGNEFYISIGLQDALHHLRSDISLSSHPILLWVDAICIDQSNDKEKTIQVLRMKETYEDACKVIIWLGDKPERREATSRAASFLHERIPLTPDGLVPILERPDYFQNPTNRTIMSTIGQDVFRRSWWWRMWVIQEVAVAKSLVVICDGHHFSWERLLYTMQWMSMMQMDVANPTPEDVAEGNIFFPNIMFKSKYRWMLANDQTIPILELLENAASCLATDPRDMIFSLLGLTLDIQSSPTVNSEHKVVCDYKRSVQEVYIDFAKVHIHTHNSLEVITASRYYKGRIAGLPSWVPDWSNMRNSSCLSLVNPGVSSRERAAIRNVYRYHALGDRRPEIEFISDNILRVSGIRVDTITQVGKPYVDLEPPGEKFDRIIQDWQAIALGKWGRRASEPYMKTEQTLLEAFDRTITADVNLVGERAQENERYLYLTSLVVWVGNDMKDIWDQWNRAKRAVYLRIKGRLFFVTSQGLFGLGPRNTEVGDVVFVLFGCNVPVVLRPSGDQWTFVGEAFVTGIMDGGLDEEIERKKSSDRSWPHEESVLIR